MVKDTRGGFLITLIKQKGSRLFEKLLSEYGIAEFNGAQGRLLYVLWQEDSIPIRELASRTGLANTTLTSMLDRMEASDLILRIPDPHDRRKTLIALSDKARGLKDKYDAVNAECNEIYYRGFTQEEYDALEAGLLRILANLDERIAQTHDKSESC